MSQPGPPELPPYLRDRVMQAVRSEPVPTRADGARRGALIVALGFAEMAVISLAISHPKRWGRPVAYLDTLVVMWTLVAIVVTWIGVGRGRSMLGRSPRSYVAIIVATPLLLLVTAIAAAMHWPATLADASTPLRHAGCVLGTLVLAVGPFVAFSRLRRGRVVRRPELTGAAMATAAAAWGAVALILVCPFTSPLHMVLGHLLPIWLIAALGWALGERLVAVRLKAG